MADLHEGSHEVTEDLREGEVGLAYGEGVKGSEDIYRGEEQ